MARRALSRFPRTAPHRSRAYLPMYMHRSLGSPVKVDERFSEFLANCDRFKVTPPHDMCMTGPSHPPCWGLKGIEEVGTEP